MRSKRVAKIILLQKVMLHYGKKSLFWSLIIFGCMSSAMVRGQKNRFQQLWMYKIFNIANFHVFHAWTMIQHFSFTFFPFFDFAMQLFSTPVTSSNLRNQSLLFTELRLLQATFCNPKFSTKFFCIQQFLQGKSCPSFRTPMSWHVVGSIFSAL